MGGSKDANTTNHLKEFSRSKWSGGSKDANTIKPTITT